VPWTDTREAPPATWRWSREHALSPTPPDEASAVSTVERLLGLRGRTVLDLGCGRGACLREAWIRGAANLIGVDPSPGAVEATGWAIDGAGVPPERSRIVRADHLGALEALGARVADLAWSHGVVEHLEPSGDLEAYLAALMALSSRWVAVSAPNPASPAYEAFRAKLLREERWIWGYEEPLPSYAPLLTRMGCEVISDGHVAGTEDAARPYYRVLPHPESDRLRRAYAEGSVVGVCTLVVARVPWSAPDAP